MTPWEIKAVAACAKFMGLPASDYNPISNERQADELAKRLGIDAVDATSTLPRRNRAPYEVWAIHQKGKPTGREYSNFTRSQAIVHEAGKMLGIE